MWRTPIRYEQRDRNNFFTQVPVAIYFSKVSVKVSYKNFSKEYNSEVWIQLNGGVEDL